MKLSHLVWQEIAHRKMNFGLALVSVVVAVATSVCALTVLRAHRLHTADRVETLKQETEDRVKSLEIETAEQVKARDDSIRKITKNLGFNVVILPKDLNLADFHASDFATQTMPEEYVDRIAESRDVVTVNHLRPALIRKLEWPEVKRQIILMGVRGVVPFVHRDPKKPLALPVPEGKVDLGHVLAQQLELEPGDSTTLLGSEFKVNKVYPARGDKDDVTVWMDLRKAQELMELEGQINMIQALECNCATIDRLAEIQAEISKVLEGQVQVIELSTKAIARAKARNEIKQQGIENLNTVKAEGQDQIDTVRRQGEAFVNQLQRMASIALPLIVVAAGVWVGLLSLANVRARRHEIGILRALGLRSGQILKVFLAKPALLGLVGAAVGYAVGFGAALLIEGQQQSMASGPLVAATLFIPTLLIGALLLTPLLTIIAGWLPAVQAASQDPTQALHEQ